MIFAGALNETLSFYKITETQTASGYKSTQEQYMFSCRAERKKNKENFVVDAGELFHDVLLTFKMRNRNEVEETNIVVYNEERYRIISIDRYQREGDMTIKIEKINE